MPIGALVDCSALSTFSNLSVTLQFSSRGMTVCCVHSPSSTSVWSHSLLVGRGRYNESISLKEIVLPEL